MTRKKVGIITFHASHNYGSMLQAYALQQTILGMGLDCEIINFRSPRQKEIFRPPFMQGTFSGKIKRTLLYMPFLKPLLRKHNLFEQFIRDELYLSPNEYASLQELQQSDIYYDYYISGSDQIWNTYCLDFDWAYFLPFVKKSKKIAYAPSMGPNSRAAIKQEYKKEIISLISNYEEVSVREFATQEVLKELLEKDYPVMIDPTLLLTANKWNEMAGEFPLIKEPYIFLYTPWFNKQVFNTAKYISEQLGYPIVISQLYNQWSNNHWIIKNTFKYHLATGPKEFLNLCKFAKCVVGGSFHLVVFSILFRTPFYAVDGMKDSRVANLLSTVGLENRSWDSTWKVSNHISLDIEFDKVTPIIESERVRCLNWLKSKLV